MTKFDEVMLRFKDELNLKNDTAIAEILEISRASYSERKKKNSIPYEKIIEICKFRQISTDFLFLNKEKTNKNETFTEKIENELKKLSEKETEYFYYLIKTKTIEKELNN